MTPGRPLPAALALLATLAIALAACSAAAGSSPTAAGSPATSPGPSGSAAGADCGTAPQPADMRAWGPPKTAPTLLPVLVSNFVACGKTRLLFLYLDSQNNVKSAPDRTLKAAFYDLGKDTGKPAATA